MKTICVVYNASSGSGNSKATIEEAFAGLSVKLLLVSIGDDLDTRLHKAIKDGAEVLVAAGGDGTVNAVAQIAFKAYRTLGVLPVGTLNHFAKDLGLPLDVRKAAQVMAAGHTQIIDCATVNDHVFVNNSSIGVYPSLVLGRERHSSKLGKWPAAAVALVVALRNLSRPRLHISIEAPQAESIVCRSPLVFVGNNSYHPTRKGIANRQSLTGGQLGLYIIRVPNALALLRVILALIAGRRPKGKAFRDISCTAFTITTSRRRLHVSLDGEVISMKSPLHYAVHPTSLSVCAPEASIS
jgi:diacylglycerol kinase family enzyme